MVKSVMAHFNQTASFGNVQHYGFVQTMESGKMLERKYHLSADRSFTPQLLN
jgi:hypothetical protein